VGNIAFVISPFSSHFIAVHRISFRAVVSAADREVALSRGSLLIHKIDVEVRELDRPQSFSCAWVICNLFVDVVKESIVFYFIRLIIQSFLNISIGT